MAAALMVAALCLTPSLAQTRPGDAPSTATATAGEVATLLAAVADHPSARAAQALAEAATLRARAVRAPLTLSAQVDLRRLTVEPASDPLPPPFDELFDIDASSETFGVRLVLRPFLFGDLADLGDQRDLEAERADLQAREARAALEAQAVQAALGAWLADLGVALAEDGLALAELAEAGTNRRADAGGASPLEVGRAELARREAAAALRDARRQHELALARAASLAGDAALSGPFDLAPVLGPTPDRLRAELDLALAGVGERNADRRLWPTVQAGYSWILDDGASLTLGLESRTLQPALSFASGGGAAAGGMPLGGFADQLPEGLTPTVRGALNVSIAWTISPQAYLEADALRRQRDAADAGLAAANERDRLTRQSLEAALLARASRVELAALELELTTLERDAADARFASGAASELERLQAQLAWRQAVLAHARARVDALAAVLDTYATFAIPLSEVLP